MMKWNVIKIERRRDGKLAQKTVTSKKISNDSLINFLISGAIFFYREENF